MMKKPILILMTLFFGLQVTSGQSQSVQQVKDKAYGGEDTEIKVFSVFNEDGTSFHFTISNSDPGTGLKTSDHFGYWDFWLYRLNDENEIIWDRSFGGTGMEEPTGIHKYGEFLYMTGVSTSPISGNKEAQSNGQVDYWVVKTDLSGNKVWDKTYGGSDGNVLYVSYQLEDGSLLLGGGSDSPQSGDKSEDGFGGSDMWLIKIDSAGNKLWDKTYGGSEVDRIEGVTVDDEGNIIVAAYSGSSPGQIRNVPLYGTRDIWVLKLDSNGEILKQGSYGGFDSELSPSLTYVDNSYYLACISFSTFPSGNKTTTNYDVDLWLLKLDKDLEIEWQKSIGGNGMEGAGFHVVIKEGKNGDIIIGTASNSDSGSGNLDGTIHYGGNDYLIISLTPDGDINWMYKTGGDETDNLSDFGFNSSNELVMVGTSGSPVSGMKTDTVSSSGDNWFVWLDVPVFVNEHKSEEHRLTLYPNPAVNEVRFELKDNTAFEHYSLLSITGNEIERGKVTSGTNTINTSSLPSGIYLIRLTGEGQSFTKRVVKR